MSTDIQTRRGLKRLVPPPLRGKLGSLPRRLRQRLRGALLSPGGPDGWLRFAFDAPAFRREHRAVAAGRRAYADGLSRPRTASYLLRRNVHRIEKGLIARPRRAVFGLEFLDATVDEFAAVRDGGGRGAEIDWARDTLARYFEATDPDHPVIAAARTRFEAALEERPDPAPDPASLPAPDPGRDLRPAPAGAAAPFRRDLSGPPPVDIAALEALAVRRRSVRAFEARPVPREAVDRAVAVAAQSPSACNRQAFSILLFDDPEAARRVGAVPAGTKSFIAGLPSIAVFVGHLRAYPNDRDRHAIYVDGGLAAMAFVTALEAQGVASCAINWADEEPAESDIAALLDLAPDDRVIVMVAFGWPDPEAPVPWSAKRPVAELRRWNPPLQPRG